MNIFPKTLLLHAFLLIALLIVLSLTASVAIFRHVNQEPRVQQQAQLVVSVVNLTRAAILSAAPEWRDTLLDELHDAEGMNVELTDPSDVLEPLAESSQGLQRMMDVVRVKLGEKTRFAAQRNGIEALWVSFFIGKDEFWVALPRERIERPVSSVLPMWGGVVLLLALLGAYFIARQVTHPLKELARAAQQVGQGKLPSALPERGAQEVIVVAHAFNQMSNDLAANERERALVLAGISHDLRTPLARVRLAAEMTDDALLREGLCEDVEQMDAVIEQFLDYARFDEEEPCMSVNIKELAEEVVPRFKPQAKSLTLELHDAPMLQARPLLLKRALGNLLDNAIKYGGGEITVQLGQAGKILELAVADRGPGIPDAQREAVKRPFIRLETARSNATGSGLGMAIVERAMRLHRGRLALENRAGGGLIARLLLPLD